MKVGGFGQEDAVHQLGVEVRHEVAVVSAARGTHLGGIREYDATRLLVKFENLIQIEQYLQFGSYCIIVDLINGKT